jgi:hypothetical protein
MLTALYDGMHLVLNKADHTFGINRQWLVLRVSMLTHAHLFGDLVFGDLRFHLAFVVTDDKK